MSSAWSQVRRSIGHRFQVSDYNINTPSGNNALQKLSPTPAYNEGVPVIFASIKDKIHYYNSGDRSAPSMIKWANGLLRRAVNGFGVGRSTRNNKRRRFRKKNNRSKTVRHRRGF